MNARTHFIFLLSLIAAAIGIVFIWPETFPSIEIVDFEMTKLLTVVGSLVVFAMLVERFLEIFVPDNKSLEKEELDANLTSYKADIALLTDVKTPSVLPKNVQLWSPAASGHEQLVALQEAEKEEKRKRIALRDKRRSLVIRVSFFVGLLIAITGVRVMYQFVEELDQLTTVQQSLFTIIDTVLTAAVISGGSDGIHKLVKIVKSFTPLSDIA